jgi:hypothetical protein
MSTPTATQGMSVRAATRLEYGIIALGLIALILIFQPFSLALFSVGCALVVLAGLVNNLLPLCEPGISLRSVVHAGLIVAFIFLVVLLVAVSAAHLYALFLIAESPAAAAAPAGTPYYREPFIWAVAAMAVVVGGLMVMLGRRRA